MKRIILTIFLLLVCAGPLWAEDVVTVGSKRDTEGYLWGEILAQLIENQTDLKVRRKFGLGGTVICFEALKAGSVDLYLEYSGSVEMMKIDRWTELDWPEIQNAVRKRHQLEWLDPLGFNNTYVLALRRETVQKKNLKTVSDLKNHPDLVFGLSHEFLSRADGWPALSAAYDLKPNRVLGLEHGLAYASLAAEHVDVMDAYSTDAKIQQFDLVLLEDDLHFFPEYLGAILVRQDFFQQHPELKAVLQKLSGKVNEARMQALNAEVQIRQRSFAEVAREYLKTEGLLKGSQKLRKRGLWILVREHLFLTFAAVACAVLIGIPLGIVISRRKKLSQVVLNLAGIAQTIPSIALLVFMIPLFGIGVFPAIVALFIYSLLPIIRNTTTGIRSLQPILIEAADGLGLTRWQRLFYVELPLALPVILAGVRTSAVIAIGTATLAAFIGAGGLGEPIVSGLALNNMEIVLSGAIPAALLAVLTELFFEGIERSVTPRGLKS